MRGGGFSSGSSGASAPRYRCDFASLNAPSGNVVELRGNPTTTINLRKLFVAKPNVVVRVKLIKASAFSTGGTSSNGTIVPLDSNNAASSASVKLYTVAPAAGAVVGTIFNAQLSGGDLVWDDAGDDQGQAIVLHNNEAVVVNLGAAVNPLDGYFEWSES